MGQVCFGPSEEEKKQMDELQKLLDEQEQQKEELTIQLDDLALEHKQLIDDTEYNINDDTEYQSKLEALSNEKKQVFKMLLKEKKNVQKLENDVGESKKQIEDLNVEYESVKSNQQNTKEKEKQKAKDKANKIQQNKGEVKPKIDVLAKYGIVLNSHDTSNNDEIKEKQIRRESKKLKEKEKRMVKTIGRIPEDPDSSSDDEDEENPDDVLLNPFSSNSAINKQSTIILDAKLDPSAEAEHLYMWLQSGNFKTKQEKKQLKTSLASILTATSEGYRQNLKYAYYDTYSRRLKKDVQNILGTTSHSMEIISSLLMTFAEMDALIISRYVSDWDVRTPADIICCRTIDQLKALSAAYSKRCKSNIKEQLKALAKNEKKNTVVHVIDKIFDFNRTEPKSVDINQLQSDLNWMLQTKNFKKESKEKLIKMFTCNSVQYIRVFYAEYKVRLKLKKDGPFLITFMDKKLGKKSIAGYYCKRRIKYALNAPDYYAKKIQKLGMLYKKNQSAIAEVFIQRLEVDLYQIKAEWKMKKYGNGGRTLTNWVKWKTGDSRSGNFLIGMLNHCERYNDFRKKQEHEQDKKTKNTKFNKLM